MSTPQVPQVTAGPPLLTQQDLAVVAEAWSRRATLSADPRAICPGQHWFKACIMTDYVWERMESTWGKKKKHVTWEIHRLIVQPAVHL